MTMTIRPVSTIEFIGLSETNTIGYAMMAGPGRIGDYSTNPPTEPYVKISLIRFLGTARFHTARLPDIADNPRHLSPSALQHN